MTAPLPPLPDWSKCDDLGKLVPSQIRAELQAYAKLAVREALERLLDLDDDGLDLRGEARAMIEEYK